MTSHENITPEQEKALNAAQVEFSLNPRFMAPQIRHLLQSQARFLDGVEKFSTAWFQRRQDATSSMIEAGRRLASQGGTDPASAMKEIVEWQSWSMERLAEDVKDCTELLSRCAGTFADDGGEALQEASGAVKPTTKPGKSDPA